MAVRLPRPRRFDMCVALGGLLGGLLLWGLGLATRPATEVYVLLPRPLAGPAAAVRHGRAASCCAGAAPRTALLVGTAAIIMDVVTRATWSSILMYTDLMYAAVLYGPPASAHRIPRITGLLAVAGAVVPFAVWREPEALLIGVVTGLVSFGPAATGLIVRNHRDAAEAARLRAEQTALLAEMDRTQAVTAERARMARELHDMVANHLSAIAIHSTAALSLDDPKTSQDALVVIRENSVRGARGDAAADRDPPGRQRRHRAGRRAHPGRARRTLVENARANGLDVTLDAGTGATVPAPVELAAYRIVQESLTNALKHAGPGRVTVCLARRDGALTVSVTSPYGDRDRPRAPGSGAGLIGMRERTALLDGVFEAGPEGSPDGKVWAVRATLPVNDTVEGDTA